MDQWGTITTYVVPVRCSAASERLAVGLEYSRGANAVTFIPFCQLVGRSFPPLPAEQDAERSARRLHTTTILRTGPPTLVSRRALDGTWTPNAAKLHAGSQRTASPHEAAPWHWEAAPFPAPVLVYDEVMRSESATLRGWLSPRKVVIAAVIIALAALTAVLVGPAGTSKPSLVLSGATSHPEAVAAGESVTVTAALRNSTGRPRTGSIVVRLSGSETSGPGDVVARVTLKSVQGGASASFPVVVQVPRALAPGHYRVTVCVKGGTDTQSCRQVEHLLRVSEPASPTLPVSPPLPAPPPPSPTSKAPTTAKSSVTSAPSPGKNPSAAAPAGAVFQTIDGFGTSERVFTDPHVFNNDVFDQAGVRPTTTALQDGVLDALYVELGLTRVRAVQPDTRATPTPVGIELTNDNADPMATDLNLFDFSGRRVDDHASLIARSKARGVKVAWTSPLNREPWMGVSPGTNDVAEYAEWLLAQIRRFNQRGGRLDYVSVANEPSFTRNQMSGEFIRDVIKNLGPRLRSEGLLVPFVIPDDIRASVAAAKATVILADPVARGYVGALATHLYDEPVTNVQAMRALADRYGLPLWMSEFSVIAINTTRPSTAVPTSLDWAMLMHDLLATYNVSAVDYLWGFIGGGDGLGALVNLNPHDSTPPGFTRTRNFYYFGQYSRFVRPGAKRVAMASSDGSIKASAYFLDNTRTIVAINPGSAPVTTTFDAPDLAGVGQLAQTRTSATESWATPGPLSVKGTSVTVTLPAQSVTTLAGTSG